MALGKLIVKRKFRWRLFDAIDLVRCRMYHGFNEAYKGFSKNMYSVFGYNPYLLIIFLVWFSLLCFLPPSLLLLSLFKIIQFSWIYIFQIIIAFSTWFMTWLKLKISLLSILIYPVSIFLMMLVTFKSMLNYGKGKTEWKGRQI